MQGFNGRSRNFYIMRRYSGEICRKSDSCPIATVFNQTKTTG